MFSEILKTYDKATSTEPFSTSEKWVQVQIVKKVQFRSKAVQINLPTRDTAVSPFKCSTTSSYTSPFKIDQLFCQEKPSKVGIVNVKKRIGFHEEEKSDSDISFFTGHPKKQDFSAFALTSSSNISDVGTDKENVEKTQRLRLTVRVIVKKPTLYIGIPSESYFIVHLIQKHTNIPLEHIDRLLPKTRNSKKTKFDRSA